MEGQVTIHINAAPDVVFALVSDVTRMGDWSPETANCEWVDGATGENVDVGALSRGPAVTLHPPDTGDGVAHDWTLVIVDMTRGLVPPA